jgi:alkylation response protein AidB-like acyl-CoA dehydrogenase
MDLLPYERSTALWHRGAFLHKRLGDLVEVAPDGALSARDVGAVLEQIYAFRAQSRKTLYRLDSGETLGPETSIDKVQLQAAEQSLFDLVADGLSRHIVFGDEDSDAEWRSEFLYSRAATIYGGSAEIQRNIIAKRLLGLGSDS